MNSRKYWTPGNYIQIPLDDNRYCYGVVTITERLAFVDYCDAKALEPDEIVALPILFEISAAKYTIGKNGWLVAGKADLNERFETKPFFYKKDIISGKYSIVDSTWMNEVPATETECQNLEKAAVWEPCHIEDRLRQHFGIQ
tara:strand:+ start:573 stop:998 length:426 start_codon:yes stop_codon:yes gene_type:complete